MENGKNLKFAFFGTPDIAVTALKEMETFGFVPALVVCNPDAPAGRKQIMTAPPVKVWAEEKGIPVFQPEDLKDRSALSPLTDEKWDIFVVLAYGKLMPEWLIELPKYKTINAHPSLLPKLRGASPIRSALLFDPDAIGVTIIQLDKELDHGPILIQQAVPLYGSTIPGRELDETLGKISGCLLVDVMQRLPKGEIVPTPQEHDKATFCHKITKDMSRLEIDPYQLPTGTEAANILRKIHAFDGWPDTFFMHEGKRIKIKAAELTPTGSLRITRIIPEGKKEMDWGGYF